MSEPPPTDPTGPPPGRGALFARDSTGRTPLFAAAERGDLEGVRAMLFGLAGTGFYPERLSLLEVKDIDGLTAADVADREGHHAVAELLRNEEFRMSMFE